MTTKTTAPTAAEIKAYFRTIDASRIRLKDVREEFRPMVEAYKEEWSKVGGGDVAVRNGMAAAFRLSAETVAKEVNGGNCPRCAGAGYFRGFSHIKNGRCFKCNGTGNVK